MRYKVLDNIYHFRKGQVISDDDIIAFKGKMGVLMSKGWFEPFTGELVQDVPAPVVPDEITTRLEDIKTDLLDDGKLNYSHDPKRKKPGRKKKSVRTKR